ncbi:hypothetical protein BKA66DRAFT_437305 [Pyrenochaeta sp. MPI-SDFR-AT-0127]|nr:hypothetical protein BKA66DRAFT_437305 [Pyrenochaeta sp. MPI-SDFR-AT-0127]
MSDSFKNAELSTNGWAAQPRSFTKSLSDVNKHEQAKLSVKDVKLPDSEIAKRTYEFAKQQLPEKTFNHSMRVVYYGYAIVQTHFPHLSPLLETYYLTCLLHDLGTTPENMHGTHMSFEYYGAFKALNFLRDSGAPQDQAEAVSEAIIRHADLGETGTLTSLGLLIQLSTVFVRGQATMQPAWRRILFVGISLIASLSALHFAFICCRTFANRVTTSRASWQDASSWIRSMYFIQTTCNVIIPFSPRPEGNVAAKRSSGTTIPRIAI